MFGFAYICWEALKYITAIKKLLTSSAILGFSITWVKFTIGLTIALKSGRSLRTLLVSTSPLTSIFFTVWAASPSPASWFNSRQGSRWPFTTSHRLPKPLTQCVTSWLTLTSVGWSARSTVGQPAWWCWWWSCTFSVSTSLAVSKSPANWLGSLA